MKKKVSVLWLIPILLLIAIDQITKQYFYLNKLMYQEKEMIKDFFYLTYLENKGASFSMLQNFRWGLVGISIIAVLVMVWFFIKNNAFLARLALSFVLAGAFGNLIDRVRQGFVIDFLHFYPFGYNFPVFNIADVCVNIGAFLLVVWVLFFYHETNMKKESRYIWK